MNMPDHVPIARKTRRQSSKQISMVHPGMHDVGAERSNPAYQPQSMEERVLHGMAGSVLIDPAIRLHEIDGHLPEDVTIGLGLIATIKAGSHFETTRYRVAGDEWKTAVLDTDIDGRAIFFKTIGKKEHAEHSEFKMLSNDLTVPQAVAMLLQ